MRKIGVTVVKVRLIKRNHADTKIKKVANKINDHPQRTVVLKGLKVDADATSYMIKDGEKKFKEFVDSFQPVNHFIELVDGTRTNG